MRAVFVAAALVFLCSFVAAQDDLPDFVPCSFSVQFSTNVYGPEGDVVAKSTDRIIRDNEVDAWRWDSDFTGIFPLEPQQFIIIWRPDNQTSYHDFGSKCKINDGRESMVPLPYDWLQEATGGMFWIREKASWDGLPCSIHHTSFTVLEYETDMTMNVHVLDDGTLVLINGTAKSDKYGLDLRYSMEVDYFEHNEEFSPVYFIPSPHCTGGKAIDAPPKSSSDFQKRCYGADGSHSVASRSVFSWAVVLMLLVAAMLF